MQPLSRQDLVKPRIAELRQQAEHARTAQAASRARRPPTEQRRHHAPAIARALARRVLAVLGVRA